MITRYRVWLDGLPLHEIDPTIFITDIQEQAPRMSIQTYPRALGDGLHLTKRTRQSLSVVVRFAIREYDTARRKAVMQKIITWAKGGKYLAVSDRPGQRLRVEVDAMPTVTSALKWTQELSITFTAYALPYWESADQAEASVTQNTGTLFIDGDGPSTRIDAEITNAGSSAVTYIGAEFDGTAIHLNGMNISPGGTVEISHDENGVLRITSGGASLLAKRMPKSSDDLLGTPGKENRIFLSGDGYLQGVFRARGVWE